MFGLGVSLVERIPVPARSLLRVLTYHRVDYIDARTDLDPTLISAEPEQFARQARWLARDFDTVSLDDVLNACRTNASLPKRAVLVTFDDAYQDFAFNAWPILKSLAVPATLFVPTAFPDEPNRSFWWDALFQAISLAPNGTELQTPWGHLAITCDTNRLSAFKLLKRELKLLPHSSLQEWVGHFVTICQGTKPKPAVLSWDGLIRLDQEGVSLVPHTHTHPLLDQLSPEEARSEIKRSRDELLQRTGKAIPVFAYPSGHYNRQTLSLLRDESFELAFTTVRGMINLKADNPLKLRRINVARTTPDNLIRIQLAASSKYASCRMPEVYPDSKSKSDNSERNIQGGSSTRQAPMPYVPTNNLVHRG